MNQLEELYTVSEYAMKYTTPENTVRSQIDRGKLQTVKGERNGRQVMLIKVNHEDVVRQSELSFESIPGQQSENKTIQHDEVVKLREQLQELQQKLFEVSIENARYEERLARIPDQEKIVQVLESAIKAKDTTIDALNNERIVINAQLIKYRGPDGQGDQADGSIPANNKPSSGPTKWFKFWE
jgi:hypothetical protein